MSQALTQPESWQRVATAYAAEVAPTFEPYAARALALAALPPGAAVADVACGPGTLTLLAARAGARVSALDFAPAMVAALEARLALEPLPVTAQVGDGMAPPWPDGTFDAAFSMFGLMFFPDRHRGLRGLHRILRPGGIAVVSSWHPLDQVPLIGAAFGALLAQLPGPPPVAGAFPLSQAEDCHAEMAAAGFESVAVEAVAHTITYPSTAALWQTMARSNVVLAGLQAALEPALWNQMWGRVLEHLEATFGAGPQHMTMTAWLTSGRRA